MTATVKLFNWNLVIRELEVSPLDVPASAEDLLEQARNPRLQKLSIPIEPDNKSLLVAGDPEQHIYVIERLREFYEKQMSKEKKEKEGKDSRDNVKRKKKKKQEDKALLDLTPGEQVIDMTILNVERNLMDTDTLIEFLIISMAQQFKMDVKQSGGLLLN